ncbi:hypothetical protein B4N89_40975 [Embleya scabrispora]|uniref:Uncharacterized protein n=1 Tax=Embleya scabrispora TaxID=159449 RepID=A0A1T3NJD5_9ACTN|nr:hypothetical protein [Embleya scabrispora]OPC76967.1 hypothetical protein B4N89_40975 [Embleya scabrispora]
MTSRWTTATPHAHRARADAVFLRGDMREPPEIAPVGFFTPEQDLDVLHAFHRALRPGGLLPMHTMVTVPGLTDGRIPAEERRRLPGGRHLIARRHLDPDTRREHGEHAVTPCDVRVYTPDEYTGLCRRAGFTATTCHGASYRDTSRNLIVLAHH